MMRLVWSILSALALVAMMVPVESVQAKEKAYQQQEARLDTDLISQHEALKSSHPDDEARELQPEELKKLLGKLELMRTESAHKCILGEPFH